MANRVSRVIEVKGGEELQRKLRELGEKAAGALREASEAGAQVILDEARRRAPGPHVEMEVGDVTADSVWVSVGPDDAHFHYGFFELGAHPHAIRAKNRKRLRFEGRDGTVFVPGVRHPGMGARPWLRPALDERAEAAVEAVRRVLAAEILKLAE